MTGLPLHAAGVVLAAAFLAGEVMLNVLLAKLSSHERMVLEERLAGRSMPEIGAGLGVSRQAVHHSERRALRKLGVSGSIESVVNRSERLGRASGLRERARHTVADHGRMARSRLGRPKWRDVGEVLSDRLWAEIEAAERDGRPLSAERWAYYADRIARAR